MALEISLKRLSVETLHDFLDYFDHRAFLNDEDWAGCYCQAYLGPSEISDGESLTKAENRQAACDRVSNGKMDGYLAFQGDRVVGWCAAGNSMLFEALPDADDELARILCFNIDPDFRNQGLAGKLLDLVIDDLVRRGFFAVEAAPRDETMTQKSFQGTLPMFESRGFQKVVEFDKGHFLVRRYFD